MYDRYLVILFDSTNHAIRAEMVAKEAGFSVRTIPTPRHISSDCGIVLRIKREDRERVLRLFLDRAVAHRGVQEFRH